MSKKVLVLLACSVKTEATINNYKNLKNLL